MSPVLKIVILWIGISLCLWVITLLARRKINERNTLVWIGGVIIVLILSANPEWLDTAAVWVGVDYPPSLLFLGSFIVLLIITLYQSIQISQLHDKIKNISQGIALQNESKNFEKDVENDKTKQDGEG